METTQDNNNTMPNIEQKDKGGFGPVIGILIVVALIALCGLSFWGSKMMDKGMEGEMMNDNFDLIDISVDDEGTITEEQFNALLDGATPASDASNTTDTTLDNALDDLGDLDSLDTELNDLGNQL